MFGWFDNLSDSAATFLGAFTGALGGLVAILIGAFYNAHLNRERDDRLRNKERLAIAVAIREELQMIREALIRNAKVWQEPPDQASIGPDLSHLIKVFPHIVPKLGLLDSEAVAPVIRAYAMIDQHAETLLMLGGQPKELPGGRRLYFVPPERSSDAAQTNENLADEVRAALEALSKQIFDDSR